MSRAHRAPPRQPLGPPVACYSRSCIFDRADGDRDQCLTERELDALDADLQTALASPAARGARGSSAACRRALASVACVNRRVVHELWVPCRFPGLDL